MTPVELELRQAERQHRALLHVLHGHVELTNPALDDPTIAYATSEIRRATERIQAAIDQLSQETTQ